MPSKERFAVSHEGMREQHAGRAPWELVKELVQNAWDEAPEATVCRVNIETTGPPQHTSVTVSDDGPGFTDIADAYTLLKSTPKRRDPAKRGRFNLGEKEFISVAVTAQVDTVGHTVFFPKEGGRRTIRNNTTRGTTVHGIMPWTPNQAEELVRTLLMFRPTGCGLTVNGEDVPTRDPVLIHSAILDTVLQDGPGEPLRRTRRKTEIHLLEPRDTQESWLYEMGIPIQAIDTPWDIDIQQKVPLPPNRTETPIRYMNAVYAEALNASFDLLPQEEFGKNWVKIAMNEQRTNRDSVIATVHGRYGDKVIFTSNDADANMKAAEDGYQLVNPRSLTPTERVRFKEDALVETARNVFGREAGLDPDKAITTQIEPTPEDQPFIEWVQDLGQACGLRPTVVFIHNPEYGIVADCTADSPTPTVRFNRTALPDEFFRAPFNLTDQLELVIHEFGHAIAQKGMEHGPRWGQGTAEAGAQIARHLFGQQS